MYPFYRLISTLLHAHSQPKLALDAVCEIHFRCRPWDLDLFMEMNNGRVLTLYDLGRFSLSVRTGLVNVLRQNKWGLAVAGSSVRYRKRIHAFNFVTMKTQLAGFDERWFFIAQSMWVNQQPCSSVLVRTCVTNAKTGKSIPTRTVAEALGAEDLHSGLPDWVQAWVEADAKRPWPPQP